VDEKSLLLFPTESSPAPVAGTRARTQYEEAGHRGRLLQSLKTLLPQASFKGSTIGGRWWTLETLLSEILVDLRRKASRSAGTEIWDVVLGRPVVFGSNAEAEKTAVERLQLAAMGAGFRAVRLEYEPVAAAAAYGVGSVSDETVLIADLGAGTSDFSVARVGPGKGDAGHRCEILANHGFRQGGDNVDGAIMWHALTEHFGRGTQYESGGKPLDVPNRIYRDLCRWDRVSFLRDTDTWDSVRLFLRTAEEKEGLERLLSLIAKDLGYGVFRAVEKTKIELAERDASKLKLEDEPIAVEIEVSIDHLREWMAPFLGEIRDGVEETLRRASVDSAAVDRVVLTGGSSLLRPVRELFGEITMPDRLIAAHPFRSVADGLFELRT